MNFVEAFQAVSDKNEREQTFNYNQHKFLNCLFHVNFPFLVIIAQNITHRKILIIKNIQFWSKMTLLKYCSFTWQRAVGQF